MRLHQRRNPSPPLSATPRRQPDRLQEALSIGALKDIRDGTMLRALKVVESRPDRETAPIPNLAQKVGRMAWSGGCGSVYSARMLTGGVYRWKTQNRSPFAR